MNSNQTAQDDGQQVVQEASQVEGSAQTQVQAVDPNVQVENVGVKADAVVVTPSQVVVPVQLEKTPEQTLAQTPPVSQEVVVPVQKPVDERPTEIKIVIPTQAYFISGIRDFVINLTKNMTGFSEQWAYRFQAVVDELCNNAIEHGSKVGEMIDITLISTKNKSLEVIVEDTGTGNEKITSQQITALLEKRKQMMTGQYLGFRGRGLPKIVAEWTDELVFEDVEGGGLRVKVKKYLRKEEDKVSSKKQNDPTHLVIK